MLSNWLIIDPLLTQWLQEDMGRGDITTLALFPETSPQGKAELIAKEEGIITGLPLVQRVFYLLDHKSHFTPLLHEGSSCYSGQKIAEISGEMSALLSGERVALNLLMRLSGIATATRHYVEQLKDYPTQFVDTRKTTPGLRILEKYATRIGGGMNHRLGLDDAVMLKDNHLSAMGGIALAMAKIKPNLPYPLSIEIETSTITEVQEAIKYPVDIIMLDNMDLETMKKAVKIIRSTNPKIKIEASGNVTLEGLKLIAETGVDYISSSATITRSSWLDISMKFL